MKTLKMVPTRVRVTSILKRAIYSGEYKSGQELSLTAIAEQLGISRTPVREAFQTLAAEGLITLRMSKGAIVNKIDQKFIKDTFEMRILLESTAAAKAAQNGLQDVDTYIAKLKNMQAHIDTIDEKNYEDLNQSIHMAIWEAADNQKLTAYLMELWNGPSTGHAIPEEQKHYRLSTEEHIQLLENIRDHKAIAASKAMERHIKRSEDNVLEYLRKRDKGTDK
ncbi:GntR family transcriptional regulator [Acidaminococcus timonensis]|uniref:GntR family transcriptional regulator n=1 Tax=Acidaminococcus timonensis TaxID=1871002 RepID=UPI002591F708|nr:GntR family transcriptional regulator [uncultured Acidaminococcus sp.]